MICLLSFHNFTRKLKYAFVYSSLMKNSRMYFIFMELNVDRNFSTFIFVYILSTQDPDISFKFLFLFFHFFLLLFFLPKQNEETSSRIAHIGILILIWHAKTTMCLDSWSTNKQTNSFSLIFKQVNVSIIQRLTHRRYFFHCKFIELHMLSSYVCIFKLLFNVIFFRYRL